MIYLDSAIISEAQIAIQLGWVKGITTNPNLLAAAQKPPQVTLKELALISPGELYYQVMAQDLQGILTEGRKAYEIIGEKTVLKIPATPVGFQAVSVLSRDITCSVTAIYSAAQAAVAQEAGAKYAIAYVNRATRLLGNGLKLLEEMAKVLAGTKTEILAASLKSPQEAAEALMAGAAHLTVPLNILQAMATHELSEQTVTEFNQNGKGILNN